MSILTDSAIRAAIKWHEILIWPFDDRCLGSNSYDVHLGRRLYRVSPPYALEALDCKESDGDLEELLIHPKVGMKLYPGNLYLGVTQEYTETHRHVPFLEGKSSLGRLGMSIHVTAGKGDIGFRGHWTMEITVAIPLRVYAGMPCGQLIWHTIEGEVDQSYHAKASAKYGDAEYSADPFPQASKMHLNF